MFNTSYEMENSLPPGASSSASGKGKEMPISLRGAFFIEPPIGIKPIWLGENLITAPMDGVWLTAHDRMLSNEVPIN